MDTIKVFTEEPEQELWRSLLQYSYMANIQRYYEEHRISYRNGNETKDDGKEDIVKLSNCISGALQQADEYYRASKEVSLQVEPLMLYYGSTNLLYAMFVLLTGRIPQINNHGIHVITNSEQKYIADTPIRFDNTTAGAIHIFAEQLGFNKNLCEYSPWLLRDFLDSIAEIRDDYDRCYSNQKSHIIPLFEVRTHEGMVEKAYLSEEDMSLMLTRIENLNSAYLRPQFVDGQRGESYVVLRHKLNGSRINQVSYSGQPYLQVAHEKAGKLITIPKELNMYVSLFILSYLCRYHPNIWNPFVTQDSTGEKLLINKLLYYSRRMLPNIVLNRITNTQVSFVSDKYAPEDRIHLVGEHEVKEIVENEVQKQVKREVANSVVRINGRN